MKSDIRVCSAWEAEHGRPVYTLGESCPGLNGAGALFSASAPHAGHVSPRVYIGDS